MTRVEYNGGPDFYVGKSTEDKPTIAVDKISEGASVLNTDNKTLEVFNGDETSENNGWSTIITFS